MSFSNQSSEMKIVLKQEGLFGAGCFWSVEAAFRKIRGISEAICGYSGGHTSNPTYDDVCTGKTGHAEVQNSVSPPS